MLFLVYTDTQGYVFDWDWVTADSKDPTVPSGASERFTCIRPAIDLPS